MAVNSENTTLAYLLNFNLLLVPSCRRNISSFSMEKLLKILRFSFAVDSLYVWTVNHWDDFWSAQVSLQYYKRQGLFSLFLGPLT